MNHSAFDDEEAEGEGAEGTRANLETSDSTDFALWCHLNGVRPFLTSGSSGEQSNNRTPAFLTVPSFEPLSHADIDFGMILDASSWSVFRPNVPRRFEHSADRQSMTIRNWHINRLPPQLFTETSIQWNIENLDISYNSFGQFPNAIKHLKHRLVVLKMNSNSLSRIPLWLNRMEKLKVLELRNNCISDLCLDSFWVPRNGKNHAEWIELVDLRSNYITKITGVSPDQCFVHKIAFDNNCIDEIDTFFKGVAKVKRVYIQNNRLVQIPVSIHWHARNLEMFDVRLNSTKMQIPMYTLSFMSKLRNSGVLRNLRISPDVFLCNSQNMKTLHLSPHYFRRGNDLDSYFDDIDIQRAIERSVVVSIARKNGKKNVFGKDLVMYISYFI